MRSLAARVVVTAALIAMLTAPMHAQQPTPAPLFTASPVSEAFRTYVRELYAKVILAAEFMPADKYGTRTATTTLTFRETLWRLLNEGTWICFRIGNVPSSGTWVQVVPGSPKDSLVARLRGDAQFCEANLARLSDTTLAEHIALDLRPDPVGSVPRVPKSVALLNATAFLADLYARVAETLRQHGIVPPKPSSQGVSDPNPGSGLMRCDPVRRLREGERWGGPGFVFALSDASDGTAYSVTSDGRGPYVFGTSNVRVVTAGGRAGVLGLGGAAEDGTPRRAIRVDLSQPVPGGGGVARGIVTDSSHLEVAAQWKAEPDGDRRRAYILPDIPVGATVEAAQIDVQFHIDGVVHALQMGPQPIGHCFTDAPAISGAGTTSGTISRPDPSTWIVDLPPGSVGRLYNVHLSYPHAVDRGLYRVALRFVIRRQ